MNKHSMIFIGLDTHKEFHEVAYCEEQRGATPVHYGRIPSSKVSVKKLIRQFESKYPGATIHVVYEAGPCGYWIYRLITSLGHCCYMAYLGLVPSEQSSGGKRHLGAITKAGNGRARRLLIEGAHSYRYPANVSTELQLRQEGLPKDIVDIAWKAQLRLCKRYQRMSKKGKHYNLIITAIAREMAAYIWAIAKEVVLTPVNPKLRLSRVPA